MNNELNPHVVVIPLGSPSADKVISGAHMTKKSVLKSARLMNGAAIAASDTDFAIVELKIGSTVLAEIDTRAAHENGLADKVSKAMNIADSAIPAGSDLTVNYNETDSGTAVALTDAILILEYFPL